MTGDLSGVNTTAAPDGPRYMIQLTRSCGPGDAAGPFAAPPPPAAAGANAGGAAEEGAPASGGGPPALPAAAGRRARGFGRPSSFTDAVSVAEAGKTMLWAGPGVISGASLYSAFPPPP